MKKTIIATALGVSLLAGATVVFAQDTMSDTKATKKAHKAHKKSKKSTATDTMSSPK